MASTSEVGVAYVRLLPSMEGFSNDAKGMLTKGLAGPARDAGDDAGRKLGGGISDGVDNSKGKLSSAAGRVGDVFKTALAGVGLVAGGLLVAGLSGAMENEAATDKLVAQLGGSEWAGEMGEIAGNLYVDAFGESVAETGEAVRKVVQNGLLPEDATNEQIEAMTAKLMTFADVLEQDMDMTTQAVSNMLRTGIADSSEEAFDVLTRGIQAGADRGGDLLEAFQEYSTMFRDIGISAEDAMGLMSQGLQAGARDADTVGDALKEFAIRAQDGSKTSREAFEAIGVDAEAAMISVAAGGDSARIALDMTLDALRNMEDPVARNAAAVGLFGTKAEDLGDALFSLDLDTAADMLGDTAGATDALGSAYDNASTKITSFKRGAMMALTEFIGGTVIPKLELLAGWLGPKLSGAFETVSQVAQAFWNAFTVGENFGGGGIFDTVGELGAKLYDAKAAVEEFWYSFTTGFTEDEGTPIERFALRVRDVVQDLSDLLSSAWSAASPFLTNKDVMVGALIGLGVAAAAYAVSMALAALSTLAAVAPFLLAAAAAAAVGAGILWLYNNVDGFKQFVDTALPKIGQLFQTTFALISTVVSGAVTAVLWIWRTFGDEIVQVASIAFALIGGLISGALDIIIGTVRAFTALLRGDWQGFLDGISQATNGAWTIIKALFSAAWESIKVMARAAWSAIQAIFGGAISTLTGKVGDGIDAVVRFFKDLPGRLRSALSSVASAITSPFSTAFNALKSLWNRTVGGFSFSIPSWVPTVGGKKFSIPKMHTGGIFDAPGGEGLALLKSGEGVFTPDQMAAMGSGSAAPAGATRLELVADGESYFLQWIRHTVRVQGGGSAQAALGQGRAG